jgi:hypothetical protein
MTQSEQSSFIEHLQRCLLLSVLTIACNLFLAVPLFGEVQLLFGCVFVLIALVLVPPKFSLIVFIGSISSFYLADQTLLFIGIYSLEVGVIAMLLRKNTFIMLASIGFWVIVGMPLIWVLAKFSPTYFQEVSALIAIQHGLNGILCAAIAASLLSIIPDKYKQGYIQQQENQLSANIFSVCASILVVPILLISFIYCGKFSRK